MHYILDSGFFVLSRGYYPNTFTSFWENLDGLVSAGMVSSVDEVKMEIEQYGGEQAHLLGWIKENRRIFTPPSEKEEGYVAQILGSYPNLLKRKKIMEGDSFADPFIIAKGLVKEQGVVVTGELPANRDKHGNIQGIPRIPDICKSYKVRCITPQQFLTEQNWRF